MILCSNHIVQRRPPLLANADKVDLLRVLPSDDKCVPSVDSLMLEICISDT